ncbi:M56 family metallopeptidase [Lewinella sp. IMCC34191]|uniref:M56 family metallopeptidase n=1 Tax=Lewinella sp. IMCC34191 TaxID=2259172 RepID=UPI000E235A48|nr:M56 family metallopeptidase [Lewinella sp. IMCC34191]
MTFNILQYLLEATLVWAALLVFYLFVFRRTTDWRTRRGFLLAAVLAGVVIPLLPSFPVGSSAGVTQLPAHVLAYIVPAGGVDSNGGTSAGAALSWSDFGLTVYLAGLVGGIGLTVYRLAVHLRPAAKTEERFRGYRVVRRVMVRSPYAAFGRIYLPADIDPELERTALLHEAAHLRAGHHWERLLLTIATVILWFHPLVWLYSRLLGEVHEYEADAAVLREVPPKTYGRQLLLATQSSTLVPALFSSPLKKRIAMLTQQTNRRLRAAHWSVLFLLLGSLVVACTAEDLGADMIPAPEARVFTLPDLQNDETAPVPENMEYPTFLHGFYAQIRYPDVERNMGQVGTIATEVRLSAEGEIVDITSEIIGGTKAAGPESFVVVGYTENSQRPDFDPVITIPEYGLDEEVERAVRSIGKFRPATKDGLPVPALLKFEVQFSLEY